MAKSTPDFGDGPAPKRYPNTKPKNAASLVLADLSGPNPRFLMGQRSNAHIFMPGFFVFPGGRMERGDLLIKQSTNVITYGSLLNQNTGILLPHFLDAHCEKLMKKLV